MTRTEYEGWEFLHISVAMTGPMSTTTASVREGILRALVEEPLLAPESFSYDERRRQPFDMDSAVKEANGLLTQMNAYLSRRNFIRYDAVWGQSKRSDIDFAFEPLSVGPEQARIFQFATRAASAYQPDFGAVLYLTKHAPSSILADERVREKRLFDRGASIQSSYFRDGVAGVGLRTFFGPMVVAQIGAERLASVPAPAVACELDWGGWQLDLAERVWEQPWTTLAESARTVMDHLRPSNWFATIEVNPRGGTATQAPTHEGWSPGGEVRAR